MNSVVLQFRTDDADPRGTPAAALGALSQHLTAAAVQVRAPDTAASEAPTLAVSVASREAARSLATALAAWSAQHPSSNIVVQLGSSQLEISGPESAEALLQRLVLAVAAGAASGTPAAPDAAAAPPAPMTALAPIAPPIAPPIASRAPFQLQELPDGPVTPIFGTLTAGRHPESGLRLPAPSGPHGGPSRRHALLSVTSGSLWVEDMGSTNGTFVNGVRVVRRTRLRPGDRLRFDRIEFEVQALQALAGPGFGVLPQIQDMAWPAAPAQQAPQAPAPVVAGEPVGVAVNAAPAVQRSAAAPAPVQAPIQAPMHGTGLPEPAGAAGSPAAAAAERKTLFIPAEQLGDMTAFVVDGSSAQPISQTLRVPAARRTEIRILDDQGPVSFRQPLQTRQRYTLQVGIRDGLKGAQESPDPEAEPEWVWVVLTDETDGDPAIEGRLFELDHRYTALRLPARGDSLGAASFRFAALPPPQVNFPPRDLSARIGVRLYHKLNLIDHTQIDLTFAGKAQVEAGPGIRSDRAERTGVRVKSMQVSGRMLEQPAAQCTARALTISISKPDPGAPYYRFTLVGANRVHPEQPGLFASRKLPKEEIDGFAAGFRDILLKALFSRSLTDVNLSITEQEALLSQLSELGDRIVTGLFSPAAQDDVLEPGEQLADGSIIQVCLGEGAEDLFLPWQILTVKPATERSSPGEPRNFWGYRFIIETKRSGDGADGPDGASAPASARVTYARGGFENEPSHYARLKAIVAESGFAATLLDPAVEAREPFLDTLSRGGGELIYVYAPGHTAPADAGRGADNPAQAQIAHLGSLLEGSTHARSDVENLRRVQRQFLQAARPSAGSSLSLKQSDVDLSAAAARMQRKGLSLNDAPIVFLNTCEAAQVWNALADSFPGFFLDHGARAVLVTQSTVPMVTADVFGMSVLEMLFQGDSLGKAVLAARWKLLQEHRNPLGLCYGLYGAADARLMNGNSQPGAQGQPTPALTFTAGPMAGGRYVLRLSGPPGQTRQWALGSDTTQDVVITGEGVSRQHAVIIHEDGRRFRIMDRLSRNGTFVNGRRVETHVLTPGTEVRLGTVTFVFELLDRSGRKWGAPLSNTPQSRSRAPIDTVLLLVGSLVAAAVIFFVLSFLRVL